MAYPDWPPAVSYKPLREDFQTVAPHLPPLATDMNGGNTRMRRQFSSAIGQLRVTLQITEAQYASFKAWERDTLGHGSSRFTMPIYEPGGGWQPRTCWFEKGSYSAVPSAAKGYWKVSFTLNVLDF